MEQKRIFLWCIPRSISSAFFRAMMNRKSIEVFFEPFIDAYYFGSERISKRFESDPINEKRSFMEIKEVCENAFPDKAEVFVKEMAYYFMRKENYAELIPQGYRHTFLIRNPEKSICSLYRTSVNMTVPGWDYFDPSETGFKEQYQMLDFVTKHLGQEAIIIDSDDLLAHPEHMLRQYCSKVGIEFQEKMVNWEHPVKNMKVFESWIPWVTDMLESKGFNLHANKTPSSTDTLILPDDIRSLIEDNMPYYQKMYELRMSPNN